MEVQVVLHQYRQHQARTQMIQSSKEKMFRKDDVTKVTVTSNRLVAITQTAVRWRRSQPAVASGGSCHPQLISTLDQLKLISWSVLVAHYQRGKYVEVLSGVKNHSLNADRSLWPSDSWTQRNQSSNQSNPLFKVMSIFVTFWADILKNSPVRPNLFNKRRHFQIFTSLVSIQDQRA